MKTTQVTAESLLERIDAFIATTGKSESHVGKEALGDDRFVSRLRQRRNCTIKTFRKMSEWLDEQGQVAA